MLPDRERLGRRCDAVVHGGVIALLVFAPLAFGAVHPWSLALVQVMVAALVLVWATKLLVCGRTTEITERLRHWCAPLLVFGAVVIFQLIPLPSAVLRVLSPNTEAIYRDNLPGWPEREAFSDVMATAATLAPRETGVLDPLISQIQTLTAQLPQNGRWRSLSLYSYGTGEELLLILTWSAVFFCSSVTRGIAQPTLRADLAGHLMMHRRMRASLRGFAPGSRWSPRSA